MSPELTRERRTLFQCFTLRELRRELDKTAIMVFGVYDFSFTLRGKG